MRYQWLPPVLAVLSCACFAAAQETKPTSAKALQAAADLLIKHQESYTRDRPMRRVRDEQLEEWQKKERERLQELRKSNADGAEWPYEGVYRVRGAVPPGYRVGGTAIVCQALVLTPGFHKSSARKMAVARSTQFMLDELEKNTLLAPGPKRGYDVRGWAHTYGLEFFLLTQRKKLNDPKVAARIQKVIPHLIKCLATNEATGGGWNYANNSCSPFMTGSTLLALFQARAQGFTVDEGMVDRALTALERARAKTGSFVYSGAVRAGRGGSQRSAMPGACARAAVAELCLYRAGRSDQARLRVAVDAFFEHWDELLKRKSQQGTHKGPYGIAPYYFMYGHTYAAVAIEALPESQRPELRKKMQETLWKTREEDGGWNDRVFPRTKSYSTAMAMLALLAPQLEPVTAWKKASKKKTTKKKRIL